MRCYSSKLQGTRVILIFVFDVVVDPLKLGQQHFVFVLWILPFRGSQPPREVN